MGSLSSKLSFPSIQKGINNWLSPEENNTTHAAEEKKPKDGGEDGNDSKKPQTESNSKIESTDLMNSKSSFENGQGERNFNSEFPSTSGDSGAVAVKSQTTSQNVIENKYTEVPHDEKNGEFFESSLVPNVAKDEIKEIPKKTEDPSNTKNDPETSVDFRLDMKKDNNEALSSNTDSLISDNKNTEHNVDQTKLAAEESSQNGNQKTEHNNTANDEVQTFSKKVLPTGNYWGLNGKLSDYSMSYFKTKHYIARGKVQYATVISRRNRPRDKNVNYFHVGKYHGQRSHNPLYYNEPSGSDTDEPGVKDDYDILLHKRQSYNSLKPQQEDKFKNKFQRLKNFKPYSDVYQRFPHVPPEIIKFSMYKKPKGLILDKDNEQPKT